MRSCGSAPVEAWSDFPRPPRNIRRGLDFRHVLLLVWLLTAAVNAQSQDATLYKEALTREAALREDLAAVRADTAADPLVERIRVMVGAYEDISQLFPDSEYGDNALWQGGVLAADLFKRFGAPEDRETALRLLKELTERFPDSPLAPKVTAHLTRLGTTAPSPAPRPPATKPAPPPPAAAPAVMLRGISRDVLPEVVRVTLELEREITFTSERLADPPRVAIDLLNVTPSQALTDARLAIGGMVRQARVTHAERRTRILFDIADAVRYSAYALYNPYRIVIDFERGRGSAQGSLLRNEPAAVGAAGDPPAGSGGAAVARSGLKAPAVPASNAGGGFSLSRQLGLGVARIAIDPGHGGHDPGAEVKGLDEAALVLDVALRLEQLLKKNHVEVVLTRRDDAYVSLEERTGIANRSQADLFLSIHANASAAATVGGVETYFLNFASNPAAEAIAARENAASSRSMRELPDLLEAIALDNKLDESRDFATIVQATVYERLRRVNRRLKNLGVKQAPFMVLVGAGMPAILAEVAFMTNTHEAALLRTERYRQQIAEALFAGIMRYQERLKKNAASGGNRTPGDFRSGGGCGYAAPAWAAPRHRAIACTG
jgi:N-acetylmuramoyl-L-alanine amidase